MRGKGYRVLLAVLLLALLVCGCGKAAPESTPEPTPEATPEAAPEPTPEPVDTAAILAEELEDVRDLIDGRRFYEAFQKLAALEEDYRDEPERLAECEDLFGRLDIQLRDLEPASGAELSRTFAVQGGGILEISAFSGPALITVTDEYAILDQNPEPPSVTFYVRQGETGQVNLPAGTYRVFYQVGYRWFGREDGFGEYCTEGELDQPLVFDFYMDGQWASTSKFHITL